MGPPSVGAEAQAVIETIDQAAACVISVFLKKVFV
jgi:hypothetical protein